METNLARLADAALDRLGEHPSLYFEGAWYTSGQLHDRAARFAGGLRDIGVRPGDRVAVIMANCPEVGITYAAVWRAGGVVTPIIFLVSAIELRHILLDSGAVAVVTTPELLPKVTEALDGHDIHTIVVGDSFAELEAGEPLPIQNRTDDQLAALLYTGGTTGRSKGVALSHANLCHAGASSRRVSHVAGLTRGISALPLSHAFGLLVTVGSYHVPEASSAVLQRWFEPASWLRLAAEQQVQTAAVVPSMLVMLLGQAVEDHDLGQLRFVFSGAAPLSRAVAESFQRRVPSATVLEGYGCTETSGIISSTPPAAPRPGTVGKAVPDMTIRIVGLDGVDVPIGEDGEIVVSGPQIMTGYWNAQPPAPPRRTGEAESGTAVAGTAGSGTAGSTEVQSGNVESVEVEPSVEAPPDGWLHTGDIGRLDADGYLTIVDRMKDLIIRGGYNVYPRDVEDVLLEHPEVFMAAVVGRPDERLGEEVIAFVSRNDGGTVTGPDLVAFARERLAAHKYPREVRIVPAIPLTSVGKLDRKRLRTEAG